LQAWMNVGHENENLEFKEAKNQYDTTKLFRYCVALANEGGGNLS
jgi:ATP-dependent DNA helicase RecG